MGGVGASCCAKAEESKSKPARGRKAIVSIRALFGWAEDSLHQLKWGRQSCLKPPFRRLLGARTGLLKAGGSQDWQPHNDKYEFMLRNVAQASACSVDTHVDACIDFVVF
jgi:hypothetical protein